MYPNNRNSNGQFQYGGAPFANQPHYNGDHGYYPANQPRQQWNAQQPQQFKKSWAVYGTIKNGKSTGLPYVRAFKINKRGLVTCSVNPYHATGLLGKENIVRNNKGDGKEYLKMMATIQVGFEKPILCPCLYNIATKVVVLQEYSMCITPTGSGMLKGGKRVSGYFGRNYKK